MYVAGHMQFAMGTSAPYRATLRKGWLKTVRLDPGNDASKSAVRKKRSSFIMMALGGVMCARAFL